MLDLINKYNLVDIKNISTDKFCIPSNKVVN